MSFIWYIIIGIVAGFLAGKIMRGGGFRSEEHTSELSHDRQSRMPSSA